MSPMEVVIEELQTDQCIPRGVPFRKGMGFARKGIEPITQSAVNTLNVSRTGLGNEVAQSGTNAQRKGAFHAHPGGGTVCVKHTFAGTASRGRPRLPERTG